MLRKEIDGQEVVMWVLAAILSLGLTGTFIKQDQAAKEPPCIHTSELLRGGIFLNLEHKYNVCQD